MSKSLLIFLYSSKIETLIFPNIYDPKISIKVVLPEFYITKACYEFMYLLTDPSLKILDKMYYLYS